MEKIYKTDSGHDMDESDFIPFIDSLMEQLKLKGYSCCESYDLIFTNDFFGDSIINENLFSVIKDFYYGCEQSKDKILKNQAI